MELIKLVESFIFETNMFWVIVVLCTLFLLLYFSINTPLYVLANYSVKIGLTKKVVDKPYFKGQVLKEIVNSLSAIIIFGLYGALIVWLLRLEFIEFKFNAGWSWLWDLLILIIWNEIHFYIGHRIMHTKPMLKFHKVHHQSKVVNPFSTYSFHPLESVIMGSVMVLILLLMPLHIYAIIIFPIFHLFFNAIGHTNVDFKRKSQHVSTISNRHNLHHTHFSVNYGFISTLTDRIGKWLNIN